MPTFAANARNLCVKYQLLLCGIGVAAIVVPMATPPALADLAQISSPAQITGVRLQHGAAGFILNLDTTYGVDLPIKTSQVENQTILVISNAQLQLPEGTSFQQANPAAGIATVEVTAPTANSVQVVITGTESAPVVNVNQDSGGIDLQVEPAPALAETPAAETPTRPGATPINLVVTATRSASELEDIPRSVTVVTQEQIQEQTALTRDLGEILGKVVPGLAPGNQSLSEFGQTLRGRNPLILIDGIPQSTNRNAARNLRIIDPSVVERIEVLRGPTAIYGDGATGGIINIITKSGGAGKPRFDGTVGLTGSLSNINADSLGGLTQLGVAGQQGAVDYRFSGSFERIGSLFDAEGDRIPPDQLSSQGSLADTNTYNLFGKVGWESGDHRVQFSVNHFNTNQDTDFVSDPAVNLLPPGTQKALARPGLVLDDQSAIRNTLLTLDYTHPDLVFGSRVHAQLFYRDYFTRFFPFDGGRFGIITPDGLQIFQSRVESQKYGGRLEIETPLVKDYLTLVSGLDYSSEDAVQPVAIFDTNAFNTSNGLVFNPVDDRPWVPPLTQRNLGLFAQLKWEPIEPLVIQGGLRHERIGVDVDTFTTLTGNQITGGNLDYDATLFNIGAIYKATDAIEVFANFAQGFSVADVGLVLRSAPVGLSVTDLSPKAQRINNYEVGVRGTWDRVQASLSGFYNTSNLGTTFDRNTLAIIRAPERVYGVEAALDVQPVERWRVGSTLSYVEGDNDPDLDDRYTPLTGFRIPPVKLTAYVENETLPGWTNRLQALYSFGRDRAFDQGIDFRSVEDYFTLDLISSLKVGPGTLKLGIQNLLNNQYFTAPSQLLRLRTNDSYTAASGRTFSLQYAFEF